MSAFKKRTTDVLFLDIETAAQTATYNELSEEFQELWHLKAKSISRNKELSRVEASELYDLKAGIFSEFAKVVCISVGFFEGTNKKLGNLRVKSFYGDDEKGLLEKFIVLLKAHFDKPKQQALCGHNIKEFDIPFLCRRMIIHNLKVPKMLDISGKKPWQVDHLLDTLVLWRFGDYKNYTSLRLLAAVLGIPSPKDDIDGSQVNEVYWKEKDHERIYQYCEKDVFTSAQVYLKLNRIDYPKELKMVSKTGH